MKKTAIYLVLCLLLINLLALPAALADTTTTTATEAEPTTTEASKDTTAASTHSTTVHYGSSTVNVIIQELDGKIAARVTDSKKAPIAGIEVGLQLGTTKMPGVLTDAGGYARFHYSFPVDDTYVYCYTEKTELDGITYAAGAAAVGKLPHGSTPATTTGSHTTAGSTRKNTTTFKGTKKTTTAKTTATEALTTYIGAGTTGMVESYISLNFSFDSGILDAFGCKEADFADNARLLLSQENYATMMDGMTGSMMLNAATSTATVSDETLTAALQNDVVLSRSSASDIKRIVMDLSLQCRDMTTGKATDIWNIAEGTYVIQLPIPKSMRSAQSIAVSAVTTDGISEPVLASVSKDGYLRFETSSPVGTIVVLGFNSGVLGALTSHAVRSSILFLVLGLLCIGGAVFLFIRFVYTPKNRKKKAAAAVMPAPETVPEEIDELPPLTGDNERIDPEAGLDIFADSEPQQHRPRHKNPADYDIEL